MSFQWSIVRALLVSVFLFALPQAPNGQTLAQDDFGDVDIFPDFSLGGFGDSGNEAEPATWSARYWITDSGSGRLEIEASLSPHWHIYSVTQKPGGPLKTKFSIVSPPSVKTTSSFTPNEPAKKSVSADYDGLTVEEHSGVVIWSAPISVPAGFNEPIKISVDGLVCEELEGKCIPVQEELTATLTAAPAPGEQANGDAATAPQVESKPFRDDKYVVEWVGMVTPGEVKPGGRGVIKFTAKPDPTFHVYRAMVDDSESSTNFVVTKKDGLKVGAPQTATPVISKAILPSLPPVHYYKGEVTWEMPIEVPADAATGERTIEGLIGYQACTDNSCHRPVGLKFTAKINVVPSPGKAVANPVTMVSAKSADVLDAAATTKWVDKIETETDEQDDLEVVPPAVEPPEKSFAGLLIFAFIGGVILNFMPCVLPVVGLKVMSFVKQAGEDRGRILMLNVVYVLGIMSVFAILAGLAVALNFSWGQQFTFFEVKLGLTLLLFALALSYLGVWEIPAPSFAASKKSQQLEGREGYLGAFSKGAFATILATPCSGPLLGYIFGTTFGLSSVETIIVIMMVGFGMSLPYLVIGARPSLVSWLPKPGAWMETLKEFLAFLFLGTVAFFFAGFSADHKLPVFVALIGVWFGCWMIGKVPNWETLTKRLTAWAMGITAASLISIGAFHYLVPGESILPWEPYNEARLAQLQREGRTVMVDFTADWCINCKVNYKVALDTESTLELIEELDAVPMLADWSDRSNTAIPAKLKELRSRSIPLLAIYPGARPDEPIILRDLVSQGAVLDALRDAGASVPESARTAPTNAPAIASSSR